jgi:cystine transport system permease protein
MEDSLFTEFVRTLAAAGRVNITLTLAAFPLTLVFAAALAGLRSIPLKPLQIVVGVYIDAIRSTPLLLHLFFVFFGLPLWNIRFDAWTSAVVTMTLHFGAYQAEVYRSAVSSIPVSVREASTALGLRGITRFRRVTLPLAFRISVPPTSNNLIDVFRGTSVVALVAVQDIVFKGTIMLQTYKGDSPIIFMIIALFFIAVGYPMSTLTKVLERRFVVV